MGGVVQIGAEIRSENFYPALRHTILVADRCTKVAAAVAVVAVVVVVTAVAVVAVAVVVVR